MDDGLAAAAAAAATRTGEIHSEEQWERIKPEFVKLYKIQGKTLPEVRKILAQKHGFYAT